MSAFEHHRFEIWNPLQHPYKHSLAEFYYTNTSLPGGTVFNAKTALDWVFKVLYPNAKAEVATVGDLPSVGNTLNDYRVVTDDGDGKQASYRWEQREGDVAAKWYKVFDFDWSSDSILAGFLDKTQDLYVHSQGKDDLDSDGVALTGVNAGQHIFGGESASTHLTLHANSGDGTGAQTGYVQLADNLRPTADSTWSLGTTAERFLKVWTDEITIDTVTIASGTYSDTSGEVDFGASDITTTGSITAGSITMSGTAGTFGTTTVDNGTISDTTGEISFADENLTTTGDLTVGTMTIAGGSITDSTGAITFGDEDLTTTGTVTAFDMDTLALDVGNLYLTGNTIASVDTNGDILIVPDGLGATRVTGDLFAGVLSITGDADIGGNMDVTGSLAAANVLISGNRVETDASNLNLELAAHGTGFLEAYDSIIPNGTHSLGSAVAAWDDLFLAGGIRDATNEISIATLLTLRNVGTANSGDSLFWDGSKWAASAPDTEIDHGAVSGLSDDDHTQYALLAGRSGGQTLSGSTLASENLVLDSTAHATKGFIELGSTTRPGSDSLYDLGSSGRSFKDLYLSGQAVGLRLQNATTAARPTASASTPGRLVWDTDLKDVVVDRGGTWAKMSLEKFHLQDASGWTGTETSATYDVSAYVSDARECIWSFKDNSNDFLQTAYDITMTQTHVTVTVAEALAAGTYTLTGIG